MLDHLTALLKRLSEAKDRAVSSIQRNFSSKAKKEQLLRRIANEARPSLLEVLNKRKEVIAQEDKERVLDAPSRKKKYDHKQAFQNRHCYIRRFDHLTI